MIRRLSSRGALWILIGALAASPACDAAAQDAAPVKKQLPADQRAFKAARAIMDPEQRLAAMRSFVKTYPKSSYTSRAEGQILSVLIEYFPQRTTEIEAQTKLLVKHSGKGTSRWNQETYAAYALAEGGSSGLELPLAEKLAKDATNRLSEPVYDKETAASYAKYKMPPPKAAVVHKEFANTRAEALAVLADVYLREGKKTEAASLISQAFSLDPMIDDVNSLRGRLALLDHNDTLALDSFERAQLLGAIGTTDRKKMMELYREAHGSKEDGFAEEMDARYAQLFPPPFTAAKAAAVDSRHTVLLELFTGSACPPCVGGDLAVDALLGAYPREEVVALAFDQHIPDPDPLTNPDSVARADFYGIEHTPNFVVDGVVQDFYGSSRDESEELYGKVTKVVNTAAALPGGGLDLTVSAETREGTVHAHAKLKLPNAGEIAKLLANKATPDPASESAKSDKAKSEKTPPSSALAAVPAPGEPKLVVNFALVEDDIRYSGENGIRFHRMVVRSLAKPADSGFPVTADGSFSLDAAFDPAAISRSLTSYLDGYEQKNDKFGKVEFITKDMTMRPGHLAIAIWVQDTLTHRVLDCAFTPVGQQQKEAE